MNTPLSRATGLVVAALHFLAVPLWGANIYHVAQRHPAASDQNTGAEQQPLQTISRGCQLARAGDTILVHGGVYRERVVFPRSGTKARPITLRGPAGETAVVEGKGVPVPKGCGLVELHRVRHIAIENLEIRNSSQDGIRAVRPVGLRFQRVNVHHCGRSGMMLTHVDERSDSLVADCDVHHSVLAGIAVWECPGGYFTLRGNRVHHNLGKSNWDGIEIIDTPYVAVLNNIVYDNAPENGVPEGDQIDAGGTNALTSPSHHVIYEGNLVYGRGGGVKMNNEPLHCIIRRNVILDTGMDFYEGPTKIAICHNTVADGRQAVQFWGNGKSANFGGTQVRNNLFVDTTAYAVSLGNKTVSSLDSVHLDYNVYRFRTGNRRGINVNAADFDATFPPSMAGLDAFHKRTGQESHGRVVRQPKDRLFVDHEARDFSLRNGSAAIDVAGSLTTVVAQLEPTLLKVANAWFFQDGWNGLLSPDMIQVGKGAPVPIVSVDYERHQVRVGKPVKAKPGAPVSYVFAGDGPDAGAKEHGLR